MIPEDYHKLKYPIGEFEKPKTITPAIIDQWINDIETFPSELKKEVEGLSAGALNAKYRPGGWMIKQVVHHCADSHMNSFIRFKLALTEEKPMIRPYYEDRWAEMVDYSDTPIEWSLQILDGLHKRWVKLLRSIDADGLQKKFVHPEHGKEFSLDENIGIYAWHCNHHLAHVRQAKEKRF